MTEDTRGIFFLFCREEGDTSVQRYSRQPRFKPSVDYAGHVLCPVIRKSHTKVFLTPFSAAGGPRPPRRPVSRLSPLPSAVLVLCAHVPIMLVLLYVHDVHSTRASSLFRARPVAPRGMFVLSRRLSSTWSKKNGEKVGRALEGTRTRYLHRKQYISKERTTRVCFRATTRPVFYIPSSLLSTPVDSP